MTTFNHNLPLEGSTVGNRELSHLVKCFKCRGEIFYNVEGGFMECLCCGKPTFTVYSMDENSEVYRKNAKWRKTMIEGMFLSSATTALGNNASIYSDPKQEENSFFALGNTKIDNEIKSRILIDEIYNKLPWYKKIFKSRRHLRHA